MYRSHYGNRKRKSGLYSESKLTNWTKYNPYSIESGKIIDEYLNNYKENDDIIIKKEKTHPKFIMPISKLDIEKKISTLPKKLIKDLKGIYLLSGTNKQEVFSNNHIYYGAYYYYFHIIVIYPFPEKLLNFFYKKLPAPHKLNDLKKSGAEIRKVKKGWEVRFSLKSLKKFYLNEVFLHELGHHVDYIYHSYDKKEKKIENFADYFVEKYRM